MNDAALMKRLCDWSEHPLQSVTTVKTNGECGAGAKTRRLDPYQGNDATRGTPKRPGAFRVFGQAIFQPYERSPNPLHGCIFVGLDSHTLAS